MDNALSLAQIRRNDACGPNGESMARLPYVLSVLKNNGFNPKHMIDVGAHRGEWSHLFSTVFPDCELVLVEPLVETASDLSRFAQQHTRARIVPYAVGDFNGVREMTIRPDLLQASSFTIDEPTSVRNKWKRLPVRMVTLDDLIRSLDISGPDLIKIDAEGYEMRILQHSQLIWDRASVLVLEACWLEDKQGVNNICEEISLLASRNFVPFDITWSMRRPTDGALFLTEIVFVRQNSRLREWV